MRTPRPLRSRLVTVAVAAILVGGVTLGAEVGQAAMPCTPTHGAHVEPAAPAPAARAAQAAMDRCFRQADGYFAGQSPDATWGAQASVAWPLTQAAAATIMAAQLDGGSLSSRARVRQVIAALERYWDRGDRPPGFNSRAPFPFGAGGDIYYDDNAWAGLDLVAASRLLGKPALLHRAEQVFTLIRHGWSTSRRLPSPGGEFWTQADVPPTRNTVSTAGGAVLGLELYRATGRVEYLRQAQKMISWVERTLRAPDGLFWDNIDNNGHIVRDQWTYNQGLMIGANTLLYQATGDRAALAEAQRIADVSLKRWSGDLFAGQPLRFNAIFLRELARLNSVAPKPEYRALAERYAAQLRRQVDPRTGLLRSGGGSLELLDQAGLVQVQAIAASMQPLDGVARHVGRLHAALVR